MSKIAFSPNDSGTGTFTIESPPTNDNRTLVLPDETGTLFTNAGGTLINGLTIGGTLNLGSTGQIQFPATQNASTDANTLDDYEEGTFTPVLVGSTSGTFNGEGRYTKIGQLVHVSMHFLGISTSNKPIGEYSIEGMPFASISSGPPDRFGGFMYSIARVTFNPSNPFNVNMGTNTTTVILDLSESNGVGGPVTEDNFVSSLNMFFRVSITYPTST